MLKKTTAKTTTKIINYPTTRRTRTLRVQLTTRAADANETEINGTLQRRMATTAVTMMMNMKMLTTMMMTQMLAMMMILMLMLVLMMVMTAMVVMMVMAVMLDMMVFSEVAARIPWSLKSHQSLRNRGVP